MLMFHATKYVIEYIAKTLPQQCARSHLIQKIDMSFALNMCAHMCLSLLYIRTISYYFLSIDTNGSPNALYFKLYYIH